MNEESIPMDCTQFEEILSDLNRPEITGTALRESALAHAESCSRCAKLLAEAESLDQGFRALAAVERDLRAPERVEAIVLQEFRRRRDAVSGRRIGRQATLGIAAAILLVVGVSLHHWVARSSGSESVAQTPAAGSAPSPTKNSAEMRARVAAQPETSISVESEERGQEVESAPLSEQNDSEDAFMPLPYADEPAALDGGAVVRVEMPRAALASFGMPVAAMEGDGTVQADLVVSEDGTPQAIRLVSQDEAGGSPQ
jgi:hypothetical protein